MSDGSRVADPGGDGLTPEQAAFLESLVPRAGDPKRRPAWQRIAMASASFAVALVLAGGALVGLVYRHYNGRIQREDVLSTTDKNIKQRAKQLNAANYLVIGSDTRAGSHGQYGNEQGARSDTTMLVHLSPDRKHATVVSFPRDSWVTIPGCKTAHGVNQRHKGMFNSAFTDGGAACTITLVQAMTGIAVTHYLQIDFGGFQSLVKALGTITVCSPAAVNDPESKLKLSKGNNKLTPSQALAYVRARYTLGDGSDLGRIQRQQRFLGAVLREARGGTLLSSPAKFTHFLDAATSAVTVDKHTSLGALKTLADALRGLDPKRVTFYTAPIANPAYNPDDPSVPGPRVLLDTKQGGVLYDSIINDQKVIIPASGSKTTKQEGNTTVTVGPSSVEVAVTNAVGTAYLGTNVQKALKAAGFKTRADLLGIDAKKAKTTEVVYNGGGQLAAAQTVAASLPGSVLTLDASHAWPIEVRVGSSYTSVHQVKVGDKLPTTLIRTTSSSASKTPPPGGITAADSSCKA